MVEPVDAPGRPVGKAPLVVATAGMRGSASTWVYNVVRELMIDAVGEHQVFPIFSEMANGVPGEADRFGRRYLVVKSHSGSAGLDAWLTAAKAPVILSVRDPRDATISMARRFAMSLERAAGLIIQDCERLLRLASLGHPLLRFEDRFFDQPSTIEQIAGVLGLRPAADTIDAIFTAYRTDAVRAFAARLSDLPPARLAMSETSAVDLVIQIHTCHIGDARAGEWRRQSPSQQASLTRLFEPWLDRLRYAFRAEPTRARQELAMPSR